MIGAMRTILTIMATAAMVVLPNQGSASKPNLVTVAVEKLRQFYQKNPRSTHALTQRIFTPNLSQPMESQGSISFAAPARFRLEITSPTPSTLVSDGKMIRYYQAPWSSTEPGTIMTMPHKQGLTGIWERLLSGQINVPKDFAAEIAKEGQLLLTPSDSSAGIKFLSIFTRPNGSLEKLVINYVAGNHTEFLMSPPTTSLADSIFQFTPPPNTKEIPYAQF